MAGELTRFNRFTIGAEHKELTEAPRIVVTCNDCTDPRDKLPLVVFRASAGNVGRHLVRAMDHHNRETHKMHIRQTLCPGCSSADTLTNSVR